MSDVTFTQEQVNEQIANAKKDWIEKELDPIMAERDELLQFKSKEMTDEEKALQSKQQELFQKEIQLELKSAGLEKFADFFVVENVDELKEKMTKFQSLLDEMKADNSYKPNDHKHTDRYNQAKSKGDTLTMIKTLFGN